MKCRWNGYPNLVVQKLANRFVGFGLIRFVRFWPLADIHATPTNVGFRGQSGIALRNVS
jgi:hypothetical protein